MSDEQPTRPLAEGEAPAPYPSGLKGLTMALGIEPAEPGQDPLLGRDIGGVTIVRLIAEGGMGRVYEGKQEKPNRTVAVKVMRPGLASPSLLKRFEYEAEVLGRLQHPGIAHIYSVGVHHMGNASVPFFVMEYIADARTLTTYANDLKLPTRQRLDLFRSVCDAVAHGHQRGVIHRDLKPSNILVNATGQPKVIDFGVARATDSDMALTTMQTDVGQLIGTLKYMSPEQLKADPNDLDVRSDVYALGVVLYELLAGRMPYDVDKKAVLEVMRIVQEDDPVPLSSLNRALKGDVAIIAGKCLEKDRGHRYSSASELGADVERYLTGDPISASPPGFVDGILRLAKKHRAAAAAVAGILASLAAAVVAISVFAIRAERARVEAEHQRALANDASEKAERARDSAVTSRKAAEELVQFMTFDLHNTLAPIGRLDLLKGVLEKLNAYHDERIRLEEAGQEDVSSDDLMHRGVFYRQLGDLAEATGNHEQARRHFEKSLEIMEALASEDPRNANRQHGLALVEDGLGKLAVARGDPTHAQKHYERLLTIAHTLSERNPEYMDLVSLGHERLGDIAQAAGDHARARSHHEKSLMIRENRVSQDQGFVQQCDLVVSHNKLGNLAINMGDTQEALRHWEKALAIMKPIAESDPRNAQWQRDLGACHDRLGVLAFVLRDYQQARVHSEKALAIVEALTTHDPQNAQWQSDLSISHSKMGEVASALRDFECAQEHHETAVATIEALAAKDPRNTKWQEQFGVSCNKFGDFAYSKGNTQQAKVLFEKAFAIAETLASQDPGNAVWQRDLEACHQRLGDLASAQGDTQSARVHHEKAIAIAEGLAAQDPQNDQWQRDLFLISMKLGSLAKAAADIQCGVMCFTKALAVTDAFAARDSSDTQFQLERGVIYDQLGDLAQANGDAPGARGYYDKALAIAETLSVCGPRNTQWQANLSVSHRKLGDLEKIEGALDRARSHYERSLAIAAAIAVQEPRNAQWQGVLAISFVRMGLVSKAGEAWDEARDWFVKALEVTDRLDSQPKTLEARKTLVEILQPLAECHRKLGEDSAAEACEKRLAELQAAAK